ncbi:MAG TPA: S-adenosylmethionine:tRNA ribosyltransferase-isomerase [Candidatus Cryptobacteroides pullicola]|nr:S-adenosylmethionine:tRNA ribosyltransferase-isomerase [Candidatus Cryptobacteroides pullicola]
MIPEIRIEDYNYSLPDERIAKYPLPRRDESKLLVYRDGTVVQKHFYDLPGLLPQDCIMVFNDTRVVPARLFFRRDTGARIEIFCLEPVSPSEYALNFASTRSCTWKCVIGNAKRWKDDILSFDAGDGSEAAAMRLKARLLGREGETGTVEFSWEGDLPFSRVLELCGQVPIPPYLNRGTEEIDLERYQTLYAHIRGSVAAPTAGLHFTDEVLGAIAARGIDMENICLHVGAGTFLPVKSSLVSEHPMHREPFVVSLAFLKDLLESGKKVAAVGTTSVRTLESLYYAGVSCIEQGKPLDIGQWDPYTRDYSYTTEESLRALTGYLEAAGMERLEVGTRIIIVPGFRFRIVDMLVTNFHQPQSTLLLLISAFVGGDWKTIYDYALANGFRFLSYGDSSLLYRR